MATNPRLFSIEVKPVGDSQPGMERFTVTSSVTLRDLFAALIAGAIFTSHFDNGEGWIAARAYEQADALLAEREAPHAR